jgi:glycosyltransferase involved in cell wall biosynthesis
MINDYNNQKNISSGSFFDYAYLKKSIFKYLEKIAISHSHLIITNSDFLTKELKKDYVNNSSKIFRLYKGIEISNHLVKNNCCWKVEDLEQIKILFVKNDFVTGGLETLSKSLSTIHLQFNITIIGPDMKYRPQIESYFKTDNVTLNFIGRQSQEKVYEHMATHHIFCVPSLQEALGVANLEALNSGIPVVSSDAGGIQEVLDYGKCGFLSKAGNPDSLADSLKMCIYNLEERKKKVLCGLKYVKNFKAEDISGNLKRILNEQV